MEAQREFKITSRTKVCREPFVDWYFSDNSDEALAQAKEDAHRYGLPEDTVFTVEEVPRGTIVG